MAVEVPTNIIETTIVFRDFKVDVKFQVRQAGNVRIAIMDIWVIVVVGATFA